MGKIKSRAQKKKEKLVKKLKAGQISEAEYKSKKKHIEKTSVAAKVKKAAKVVTGAGLGLATGGLAGLAAGAYGGFRGAKAGSWRPVLTGVGAGLGLGALTGQGLGSSLYQGVIKPAAGWVGKGLGLGGTATTATTADAAAKAAAGGGTWGSTFSKIGDVLGLGAGLYGGYQGIQQFKAAQDLQELQNELLAGMGDEGAGAEEYRQKMFQEMWKPAELEYSASMFRRGLGGSSLYGEGLADLESRLQTQAYFGGEQLRAGRADERLRQLGIVSPAASEAAQAGLSGLTGLAYLGGKKAGRG